MFILNTFFIIESKIGGTTMLRKNIEELLTKSEQNGWGYEGMALSRNSLIHLCLRLEDQEKVYHILELGGGQSTLFWKYLSSSGLLKIKVTTLEHDNDWATQLSTRVEDLENITVHSQTLKQVTDEEWEKSSRILNQLIWFGNLMEKQFLKTNTIFSAFTTLFTLR